MKSELFEYEAFYNYLNQKNHLPKTDYEEHLEDSVRFKNRWDYLLVYNNNDVEMMIKTIDDIIQINAKCNVDLISNFSLSKIT